MAITSYVQRYLDALESDLLRANTRPRSVAGNDEKGLITMRLQPIIYTTDGTP